MDKRSLHHLWTRIRPMKTWYFLIPFVLSATVCVLALKSNNVTMIKLRSDVFQADMNNGNVELALRKLRTYVASHMNTSLTTSTSVYPPIQLKYTYERLVEAETTQAINTNSRVYTEAQHYCENLYPNSFSGGPRVPCIEKYISEHGVKPKIIPSSLYKFDFVSPTWSPDLAGWSALVSIFFLILVVIRFGLGRWLAFVTR